MEDKPHREKVMITLPMLSEFYLSDMSLRN